MRICSKIYCNDLGINKGDGHNRTYYCDKHYRFIYMRKCAKRRKKYIPSYIELEFLLKLLNNMQCPICKKQMIWITKYGQRNKVISLQHNNNGNILLICQGCNAGHGNSKLGDRYFDLKKDEKNCPSCNKVLYKNLFHKNKAQSDGFDCICKTCSKNNREQYKLIHICIGCRKNKLAKHSVRFCIKCLGKDKIRSKEKRKIIDSRKNKDL